MATLNSIFSAIIETLETYSAEIPSARRFNVHPDFFRDVPGGPDNWVFVSINNIRANGRSSARGKHYEYTAQYYLDCIAARRGLASGAILTPADERAGEATRQLVDDVLVALFRTEGIDLGLAPGILGSRPFPQVDFLALQSQTSETGIFAGRITLELTAAFEPPTAEGTPIELVDVSGGQFGAIVVPDSDSSS